MLEYAIVHNHSERQSDERIFSKSLTYSQLLREFPYCVQVPITPVWYNVTSPVPVQKHSRQFIIEKEVLAISEKQPNKNWISIDIQQYVHAIMLEKETMPISLHQVSTVFAIHCWRLCRLSHPL